MKCLLILIVGALLIGFPSPSLAQDTKTANGKVTAVDGGSLTVRVADKDMVFAVDAKSNIVAPRSYPGPAAKAAGRAGPTLVELVKVGQIVQVMYHEAEMHAATIRVLPKALRATGVVSKLSPASVTLKGADGEWTFVVDAKTRVVPGAGTTARQKSAAGAKPMITDLVTTGDNVAVTFREMDGAKHAAEVRVMKKAIPHR